MFVVDVVCSLFVVVCFVVGLLLLLFWCVYVVLLLLLFVLLVSVVVFVMVMILVSFILSGSESSKPCETLGQSDTNVSLPWRSVHVVLAVGAGNFRCVLCVVAVVCCLLFVVLVVVVVGCCC